MKTLVLSISMLLGCAATAQTDTLKAEDVAEQIAEMDELKSNMRRLANELDSIWRDFERQQGYENCANGYYAEVAHEDIADGSTTTTYSKTCIWSQTRIMLTDDQLFTCEIEREGENGYASGTWSVAQNNTIVLVSDEQQSKEQVSELNLNDDTPWVYEPQLGVLFVMEEDGLYDYNTYQRLFSTH